MLLVWGPREVRAVSAGSKVAVRGMVTVRLIFWCNPGKSLWEISERALCCCILEGL